MHSVRPDAGMLPCPADRADQANSSRCMYDAPMKLAPAIMAKADRSLQFTSCMHGQ
jgi:hypothetical protein